MSPRASENEKRWVSSLNERDCMGSIKSPHSFLAKLRLRAIKSSRSDRAAVGIVMVV